MRELGLPSPDHATFSTTLCWLPWASVSTSSERRGGGAPALPTLHGAGGEVRWDDGRKVPREGLLRSDVRGQMSGQPSGAPGWGPFHQPGRHWGLAPYGVGEPAEPRQGEGMCSGASRDEGGVH